MYALSVTENALRATFPSSLTEEVVGHFREAIRKLNSGDYKSSLHEAGFFAEHTMRALQLVATGSLPLEIKNFNQAVLSLSKVDAMAESASWLIPRILHSSVYDMRSKRGAAHVKGVNPQKRNALLAVGAMAWTLAELLSSYGDLEGLELDSVVAALLRRPSPIVEHLGGSTW